MSRAHVSQKVKYLLGGDQINSLSSRVGGKGQNQLGILLETGFGVVSLQRPAQSGYQRSKKKEEKKRY